MFTFGLPHVSASRVREVGKENETHRSAFPASLGFRPESSPFFLTGAKLFRSGSGRSHKQGDSICFLLARVKIMAVSFLIFNFNITFAEVL